MSSIIIGNSSWQNEGGTDTSGGWNSGGFIWGSSSDDVFTFANQSWITDVLGSQSWVAPTAPAARTPWTLLPRQPL